MYTITSERMQMQFVRYGNVGETYKGKMTGINN